LGELSVIEQEKGAKKMAQAEEQETKQKRKEIWHEKLKEYDRRCEEATKKGLTHTSAGPKPLLRNVQLPGSAPQPSTSADLPQTQVYNRRAPGNRGNSDLDLIVGDVLLWDDEESDESESK
jgi:hypothetical protein